MSSDELNIFLKSLSKIQSNHDTGQSLGQELKDVKSEKETEAIDSADHLEAIDNILKEDTIEKIVQKATEKGAIEDDITEDKDSLKNKLNNKLDNQNDNINLNHRDRVKMRFLESSGDVFQDYEIIEMLLFFFIPRIDVKPIAKNIVHYFKSIDNIFKAKDSEINKFVSNVKNFKFLLKLIMEINSRRLKDNITKNDIFLQKENFKTYCEEISFCCNANCIFIILLNKNNKIISHFYFTICDIKDTNILMRNIFEIILSKQELSKIIIFKKYYNINNIEFEINNFLDEEKVFFIKFYNILTKFNIEIINEI